MENTDIFEFRTPWKNENFLKNKSAFLTTKRLIKKSIAIGMNQLIIRFSFDQIYF
jgi:hypothetical protein